MPKTTTPDGIAGAIAAMVAEYTEEVSEAIEAEVDATTEVIKKEVERLSPSDPKTTKNKYNKGWRVRRKKSGGEVENIIYQKNKPQLTHLLEDGFVHASGEPTEAQPHMRPPFDNEIPKMERRIEVIIERGG